MRRRRLAVARRARVAERRQQGAGQQGHQPGRHQQEGHQQEGRRRAGPEAAAAGLPVAVPAGRRRGAGVVRQRTP